MAGVIIAPASRYATGRQSPPTAKPLPGLRFWPVDLDGAGRERSSVRGGVVPLACVDDQARLVHRHLDPAPAAVPAIVGRVVAEGVLEAKLVQDPVERGPQTP